MASRLDRLLRRYDAADFMLQQKARVLFGICLTILCLIPPLIFYIALYAQQSPKVWGPAAAAFILIALAVWLLIKGRYIVSSHMVLLTCLIAVWLATFLDTGGPVMRLDTIVLILAILTMTPLIIIENKWAIIFYFLGNAFVLVVFMTLNWHSLALPHTALVDYLIDNLFAFIFICVTSYYVFTISKRALDRANQDILNRKQAEQETATAKAFLESSLASIPEGVLLLDEKSRFTYVNPTLLGWVEKAESDFVGKSVTDILDRYVDGDSKRLVQKEVLERIVKGETVIGTEIRIKDEKGGFKPMAITASGITDENHQIVGGIAILVDLTERKQLESQLRQSQKMEAIGTLAGGIAHDFNNILSAIMGNTELILMKHPADGKYDKKLESIYSACERAKDLIGQILAFSRKSSAEPRPVLMQAIVKENLKLLKASLPSTIEIRQHVADASMYVMADPTQIHQILMNLCTNAHHAMVQAGGVMEVDLSGVDIQAGGNAANAPVAAGAWIKLTVSDTGEGIPEAIRDRIFDPYFSTKGKGLGTGLGLAVVHGIVKTYGGAVEVWSQPGKGSVFSVYLPRLADFVDSKVRPSPPLHQGRKERVLVVDDEPMILDFAREALKQLGYRVEATTRPEEALDWFQADSGRFDLVITDMTMPGMTGDKLAGEILRIRPDIPVVLCTGYSERLDRHHAQAMGIKAFHMKPLNLHELSETLHQLLHPDASAAAYLSS